MLWSKRSPPPPNAPSFTGAAYRLQSRLLWQSIHAATLLAKYLPLAIRSGVLSIASVSGLPVLGNNATIHVATRAINITNDNTIIETVLKILLFIVQG